MRALLIAALLPTLAAATDYHVGPGQTYTSIGAVPWYTLAAGDTVYIHHRTEAQGGAYHEKVLISSRGTPDNWIRVLGVPGAGGERPVISGQNATTSTNMHHRWQTPTDVQYLGLMQIMVRSGATYDIPGYIEIAGIQFQDVYPGMGFTAENGASSDYITFSSCLYMRAPHHVLVRDNVFTNCGQGVYNWAGDGSDLNAYYGAIPTGIVIRGNHFYGNGGASAGTEHQVYTESDGVIIEHNRFGAMRSGALGSHIKDRSAGTVVRYNFIEEAAYGWYVDLVEPENAWSVLGSSNPRYGEDFVYGNVFINNTNNSPNWIHWNEDHQQGTRGRAYKPGARLTLYNNTIVHNRTAPGSPATNLVNTNFGAQTCQAAPLPGVIDVRNNLIVANPGSTANVPSIRFGFCGSEHFDFGVNWVSPGWATHRAGAPYSTGVVAGAANVVSPAANNPGFVDLANDNVHLLTGSSAGGIGGALAAEVTSNVLGLNLTPTQQYLAHLQVEARPAYGPGSDLGAFDGDTVPVTLTGVAVSPATATIEVGQLQSFACTATYSDASTASCTSGSTWTSSVTGVATMSGWTATGVGVGTSTVSATYSGQTGAATLTVEPAPPEPGSVSTTLKTGARWGGVKVK